MKVNKYPSLSKDVYMHFFGKNSIIIDKMGIEYFYDEPQTDILELCDGKNSYEDIVKKLIRIYSVNVSQYEIVETSIMTFVDKQIKKNILSINEEPVDEMGNMYGERGKYYPNELSLEVTSRCNFRCPHCYKSAIHEGIDIDEEVIRYISEKFANKTRQIQLTGGEPFLNPNITNYINVFAEKFRISVPTNGSLLYLLDDEIVSKLNFVQFSLYGRNAKEYLTMTGCMDGYERLKKSISKVKQCGVDYTLSVVLSKDKIKQMEDYILTAIELGANRIKFGIPTPVGRAGGKEQDNNEYLLEQDDIREAFRMSKILRKKYSSSITVAVWSHRSQEPRKSIFPEEVFQKMLPCGAGYLSYVISQNARLRPCELMSEDIFDLGEYTKLDDYVNGQFYLEYTSSLNKYKEMLNSQGIELQHICDPIVSLYERESKD